MDVLHLKKKNKTNKTEKKGLNLEINHFGRHELTELNWIFFNGYRLSRDYYNKYLVAFDGNCSQNPR